MLILCVLFIFSAKLVITQQRSKMLGQLESYGTEVSQFIANISIAPIQKYSIYHLENYAFQFEQGQLIAFCNIYDNNGSLLAQGKNRERNDGKTGDYNNHTIQVFSAVISENGISYGRVDVGLYVKPIYSNINRTTLYIIVGFCFGVVIITGAVSFFIHQQLVRPILRLSKTTRTIADGKFVTSDLSRRNDEIGELAGAINLMSGNLNDSYRFLENKVEERTAELYLAKNLAETSNRHLQIAGEEVQALLDNSSVGIVFVTNELKILRANREFFRIIGFELEEIVGKSARLFFADEQGFHEFLDHSSQLDDQGLFQHQTELQKKDGSLITCAVQGRHTLLSGGVQGIVLNFEDITSRLLIEDELHKMRKLESVRVLARGIAHDFNNILAVILGNISLVERLVDQDAQIQNLLTEARKGSLRARDLTAKLLSFAKTSDPVTTIEQLPDLLKTSIPLALAGSRVTCELDLEDGLWKVPMDKNQIDSVIQSIVLNAKEAMDGKGTVIICCRNRELGAKDVATLEKGSYVKITIADTGSGVAPHLIDNVFDPYFSTKEKDSNKGSGLGLSIVRSIVVKHNGAIFLESEPDKGCLVTLYLPAVANDGQVQKKVEQIVPTGKGVVVVTDNDEAVQELVKEMLSYLGYEHLASHSLEETAGVVDRLAREKIKNVVVLIDQILLQEKTKAEVLRMFTNKSTKVRLIVCLENNGKSSQAETVEAGFGDILTKPVQLLDLSRVLRSSENNV
jgi:PAS domain S-box-containing protein